jgi:hypothetical protein
MASDRADVAHIDTAANFDPRMDIPPGDKQKSAAPKEVPRLTIN